MAGEAQSSQQEPVNLEEIEEFLKKIKGAEESSARKDNKGKGKI